MRSKAGQVGFTLVELLVSIALGVFLSAAIVNIFIDSKGNYLFEDQLARIQENGRYAVDLLKRDLSLSGFNGSMLDPITPVAVGTDCASGNWALDNDPPVEFVNDFDSGSATSIVTSSGTTLTCLPAVANILSGTDIVTVKHTAGDYTVKNGYYNDGVTSAADNQWYLRIASYGETVGFVNYGTGGFPSADVTNDSKVDFWEYHTKIFFIRNFSRTAGDGIPTLCVAFLEGDDMTTECLVEGIEQMHVEFGVDTSADGTPDQFYAAPTAAQMTDAVTARVFLLVRSIAEIQEYTDTSTYQLGSKAVAAANDHHMRKVFSTTFQMRNSVLPTL